MRDERPSAQLRASWSVQGSSAAYSVGEETEERKGAEAETGKSATCAEAEGEGGEVLPVHVRYFVGIGCVQGWQPVRRRLKVKLPPSGHRLGPAQEDSAIQHCA